MNAQFIVEYGIPIPSGPVTRSQGPNRRALEETLRSMKVGGSFPISSPHLTGEAHCVAANLGLDILIRSEGKAWRCWLVGVYEGGEVAGARINEKGPPLPKSLPPEPVNRALGETVVTGGRSEREITDYLEKRGLTIDYAQDKTRFRHPQRLSRILTLHPLKDGEVRLVFTHALPEFTEMWNISPNGELPLNFDFVEVCEALDDFFEVVIEDPPPGSLPFDERMKEIEGVIKKLSNRHHHVGNYEVNYDDLVAIAREKAYEVYIRFGDKPSYDFQCLCKRSIERKFDSLLNKQFLSKCRAGAKVVSLTDELIEVLPSEKEAEEEIVTKEEFNEYLEKLTPTERLLMKSVISPTDSLRAEEALNRLRYERVKSQQPKSRLALPKYRLRKLALSTDKSENELKIALAHLIEQNPSTAWDELVESLNG